MQPPIVDATNAPIMDGNNNQFDFGDFGDIDEILANECNQGNQLFNLRERISNHMKPSWRSCQIDVKYDITCYVNKLQLL